MNQLDEPKTVLNSFYKHQDEIRRQTEMQAHYVAKAVESAAFLVRGCPRREEQQTVIEAAAYIVRGVWHNRVVCGLADGDNFDQFWRLVIDQYKPRVELMRVCRSETRARAFVLEIKPHHSVELFAISVEL